MWNSIPITLENILHIFQNVFTSLLAQDIFDQLMEKYLNSHRSDAMSESS